MRGRHIIVNELPFTMTEAELLRREKIVHFQIHLNGDVTVLLSNGRVYQRNAPPDSWARWKEVDWMEEIIRVQGQKERQFGG